MSKVNQSVNFERLSESLAKDHKMITCLFNAKSENPSWQCRIYAVVNGNRIFIDVIDTKRLTIAIHPVNHLVQLPLEVVMRVRRQVRSIVDRVMFAGEF